MLAEKFTIADDFPPASYDEWRALVEADLKGAQFEKKLVTHTYEGIDVQPLYTRGHHSGDGDPFGFPGLPPYVRGSRPLGAAATKWDLRQECATPDLAAANRAILDDIEGGATSLLLRLDEACRSGFDPDNPAASELVGSDGMMLYAVDDFDAALKNVVLDRVGTSLDAGASFLPAAAMLAAFWQRQGLPFEKARGAFNADPWAVLAGTGRLPFVPAAAKAMLGDLAKWTEDNLPLVASVGVDTSVYHHAGATAAQDLAFGMATAVDYLRAMVAAGLGVDAAARQILFRIRVGTHHFLAIAKLRAARKLWSRVVEACGGSPAAGGMHIHARLSERVLTQRDPYVNMLRNVVGVFAAAIAGAETITSVPFDYLAGASTDFGRRVARNTVLILQEEAHLDRVVDPAGGSWFLDEITDQVAREAWSIFQEIEQRGGMLAVMQGGWLAARIEFAYAPRAQDIARRKEGITGVSEFPNVREELLMRPWLDADALLAAAKDSLSRFRRQSRPLDELTSAASMTAAAVGAAAQGASLGQLAVALGFNRSVVEVEPLATRSIARPFEELRSASDDWLELHGHRPQVFLVNLGSAAHHTARAAYAKNFFEAGGFEVIGNDGFPDADTAAQSFAESGAKIAVVCSSDQVYPTLVPRVAPLLKTAGARTVVLAGNPGVNEAAWREGGVDRFIFIKCDVLGALREMLREEGVLSS